jgi:hypothetical protein
MNAAPRVPARLCVGVDKIDGQWFSPDAFRSGRDVDLVRITSGAFSFDARFETQAAPATVAAFRRMLPYRNRMVHVRWSGEACWVPMGAFDAGVGFENATSYPAPGHILLYPGGISETEILIAYGPVHFASKAGTLAGNHCMTIEGDLDALAQLGRQTLWEGAQELCFALADA